MIKVQKIDIINQRLISRTAEIMIDSFLEKNIIKKQREKGQVELFRTIRDPDYSARDFTSKTITSIYNSVKMSLKLIMSFSAVVCNIQIIKIIMKLS